jgi:hypothetical protein
MRKWIKLFENPNVITVYHGDQKPEVVAHPRMFFTECEDFASDYGPHISKWELNVMSFADSLDRDLIEELLPLYDPHTDHDINDWSDYVDRSSDTWEMIEDRADDIVKMAGAAGLIVYEGGIRNYIVYDTSVIRRLA